MHVLDIEKAKVEIGQVDTHRYCAGIRNSGDLQSVHWVDVYRQVRQSPIQFMQELVVLLRYVESGHEDRHRFW